MEKTLDKLMALDEMLEMIPKIYGPNDIPVIESDPLGSLTLFKDGEEVWVRTHWGYYTEEEILHHVDCVFVFCPSVFGWAKIKTQQ